MASNNVVILTQENFQTEVLSSSVPVLVDFYTDWCGPCKMLAPILEELAGDYTGKVKFGKVNAEEQQDLAVQYGIRAFPTMLMFDKGQVSQQILGLKSKRELKNSLYQVAAPA